jgi:hypothetical protein
VTALGAQLRQASRDIYRAPEMRGAMFEADPLVQRILTGLAQSVAQRPEAESAAAATRDAAGLAAARAYYQALLREVGEGHRMLARRAGRITGDEALADIRRAEDALRRAMAELPRGLGLPPPPPGAPPSHPPARRGWFW